MDRALRLSRRAALEAGWLGALSIGAAGVLRGRAAAGPADAGPGFGQAKRCILLFMWGGPSQIDTWDPKPDAPEEIRGEFRPIATSVPGTFVSEHFPRLAGLAHKYSIVRSLSHTDPAHLSSVHHLLTGAYAPKVNSDADPPSPNDFPTVGAVLSQRIGPQNGLPASVTTPWIVSHPAAPGGKAPGQHAGWLGRRYDPLLVGDPNEAGFRVPGCVLPSDVPGERVASRRELLEQLDAAGASGAPAEWSSFVDHAIRLVSSPQAQTAFRLELEPLSVRERYGRNTHGQCVLLARRLIEAGVSLVTVNWHNDGHNFWDTHGDNFRQLKDRLMPPADLAFSALIEDLEFRGLLDETLVVWVGEFGRRPQITKGNAGREHWPQCFSGVLAGGGVRGGLVYGASDRIAAHPSENPVSPGDLVATIYHALGVPRTATLYDRQNVPKRLYHGRVLDPLFA
jgi:hypothetical protein